MKIDYPIAVSLKLTNKCNYNCIHCMANSGSETISEMRTEEILGLIDELDKNKIFALDLTGGECLTHKDFKEILGYCRDKFFSTIISSNASLIDEEMAGIFKNNRVTLVKVSLDSAEETVTNYIRGRADAFNSTITGIKNLRKRNIPVAIQTAISKINYKNIDELVKLCRKIDVTAINFFIVLPGGRAQNLNKEIFLPNDLDGFYHKLAKLKAKNTDIVFLHDSPLHCVHEIINAKKKINNGTACLAAKTAVFIKENGDVIPCPYFDMAVMGNVLNEPLKNIWENSSIRRDLLSKEKLDKECRTCKYTDQCFGGCRAAAFTKYGTISKSDPYCFVRKEYE